MGYRPIRVARSVATNISGDMTVTGTLQASDFKILKDLKISGSLHAGDSASDIHIFTGSTNFAGDVNISGTLTANEFKVNIVNQQVVNISSTGSTNFGDSFDDVHIFTGSMYVTGGSVGIGTASPISKLEVSGGLTITDAWPDMTLKSTTNSQEGRLLWTEPGNAAYGAIKMSPTDTAPMRFFTSGIAYGDEKMRITYDGNVGIGTTSPEYTLDVIRTGRFGSNLTVSGNLMLANNAQIPTTKHLYFGNDNECSISHKDGGQDFLVISGSTNGIVLSGSTVRIAGTLEGASPLKIGGEVQFTSAGEDAAFNFGPNKESKIYYKDGSAGILVISGSAAKGVVLSGSHVIVDQKLGVGIPCADVTHAITLPNNDNTTGRIKANAFVSYSSQRYKKDIEVLNDPMDVLNKLNGVSFKWRDTDRIDYGFIAEDVGKVLPGIVSWEDNKKDAQGMDYLKIISFLVEAVKKQQKQIDELNQKLKK